jgi:hypothetical protein
MALAQTASPFDWAHVTEYHAAILEAYFALFQERDPATLGSGEIVAWFRARGRTPPSESLIRTVLAAVEAPRRAGGRPANDTRASAAPPLPPIRTPAPRARGRRPR